MTVKGMYKIRFNLGRGSNYMKWKVTDPDGNVTFYNPELYNIIFFNGTLHNRFKAAKKIHEGANKYPCAWIKCEWVIPRFKGEYNYEGMTEVSYNPKVTPYWRDEEGNNIDNSLIILGSTSGKKVFEIK